MKKIIFTICSNNYLAQAKTLGDSVLRHQPDYTFFIFLCDKKSSQVDYSHFKEFELREISDLTIPKLKSMISQYNIVELNTSVKPFCFEHLYTEYQADIVMYFDPDTCLFSDLNSIEAKLEEHDAVLTPHILSPIEFDGFEPTENTFTNFGIYNLGFLATKNTENIWKMLDWWKSRLEINCYIRYEQGVFVDQLPMNYAPLFFDKIYVSKHFGLNMAPWNLHERKLSNLDNEYQVNKVCPLVFYHFSNYNPNVPEVLASHYDRFILAEDEILKEFYEWYRQELLTNDYNILSEIECVYAKGTKKPVKNVRANRQATIKVVLKYLKKYPLFFLRKDFWC